MPIYIIPTVLDKSRLRYYSLSQADNLIHRDGTWAIHSGPAATQGVGGADTGAQTTWIKLAFTSCRWRPI